MASQPEHDLYSDDSGHDAPVQESEAFSPTDGYFQPSVDTRQAPAAEGSTSGIRAPSHAVPHIPDVIVEDPTFSEPQLTKEREALQHVQHNSTVSEEPLAESAAHSGPRAAQDADHSGAMQSFHGDRAEGLNSSSHGLNLAVSQASPSQTSHHATPTAATRSPASELMLPVQAIDAPPAYSPGRSRNYGTVTPSAGEPSPRAPTEETESVYSDSQPLLPARTPSVIGSLDGGPSGTANKPFLSNRGSKVVLFLTIFFTAAFSSLITAAIILLPQASQRELIDAEPISWPNDEPPLVWKPPIDWRCRNTPHRINEAVYSLTIGHESAINIIEESWKGASGSAEATAVRFFGDIVVRSSPLIVSPEVSLDGFSNDPSILPRLNINSGHLTQSYYLTGPPPVLDWPDDGSVPCYQGRITLSLPAGTTFKDLALSSEQFNLLLRTGLNISVTEGFAATTNSGNIVAPVIVTADKGSIAPYRLQSPGSLVVSASGNIQGWFPLYNELGLVSGSGDVVTQLGLKPLDPSQDPSARLMASSRGGNVNVTSVPPQRNKFGERDGNYPLRDYASVLQTNIGNITAKMAIGSRAEFNVVYGNIDVDLQPILGHNSREQNRSPLLSTVSEVGNTKIRVREPIWAEIKYTKNGNPTPIMSEDIMAQRTKSMNRKSFFTTLPPSVKPGIPVDPRAHYNATNQATIRNKPWGDFETRHSASDGNLLITYPDSWTGLVRWQGTSKPVTFLAYGLTILRQWGSSTKHIEARRGAGGSVVNIDSQGGSVILAIGQEIGENATESLLSRP